MKIWAFLEVVRNPQAVINTNPGLKSIYLPKP
jgi:hypothetical protein